MGRVLKSAFEGGGEHIVDGCERPKLVLLLGHSELVVSQEEHMKLICVLNLELVGVALSLLNLLTRVIHRTL